MGLRTGAGVYGGGAWNRHPGHGEERAPRFFTIRPRYESKKMLDP